MLAEDVRRPRVVASTALIALLALVAVPGSVGSRVPNPESQVDPDLFERVEVAALVRGTVMTIQPPDPGARSAGNLDQGSTLFEPAQRTEPPQAPVRGCPAPGRRRVRSCKNPWRWDGNVSWYGPELLRQADGVRPGDDQDARSASRIGRCRAGRWSPSATRPTGAR